MPLAYTAKDTGCYADGAFGHSHIRERLAELVEDVARAQDFEHAGYNIPESLRSEKPPDDLSDEDDAIDVLQQFTESGLVWTFDSGDLLLLRADRA